MASNYSVTGLDFDSIFKPILSTKRADVGFTVSNGAGIQGDISNRYEKSAGNGSSNTDQIAFNTNYQYAGTDLRYYFMDLYEVLRPSISVQPSNQSVIAGNTLTFSITASASIGGGTLHYAWERDVGAGWTSVGTDSSALSYGSASTSDEGSYRCTVSDSNGSILSNTATATVYVTPVINGGTVTTTPQGYNEGDGPTLTVTTSAGNYLHYQWKLGGSNVGTDSTSYSFTVSTSTVGTYVVHVYNSLTSVDSSNCVVYIIPPLINGGTVTTTPQGYNEGDGPTLTVTTSQGTNLSYSWQKWNGSSWVQVSTSSSYNFGITTTSVGTYRVVVSNNGGSDTSSNCVIYIIPPHINGGAVQYGPYAFDKGDTIYLDVTTDAGTNLHYQWKRNGSNVGTDSTSYSVGANDSTAGTYTVVVTNNGGSDTSADCVCTIITYACQANNNTGGTSVALNGNGSGSVIYLEKDTYSLVATPSSGWVFDHWSGDTGGVASTTTASTTVSITADTTVTANFLEEFTITANNSTGGLYAAIDGDGSGSPHTVVDTRTYSLTAAPDTGYSFVNWTGDTAGVANVNSASTTITCLGANASVTANFA